MRGARNVRYTLIKHCRNFPASRVNFSTQNLRWFRADHIIGKTDDNFYSMNFIVYCRGQSFPSCRYFGSTPQFCAPAQKIQSRHFTLSLNGPFVEAVMIISSKASLAEGNRKWSNKRGMPPQNDNASLLRIHPARFCAYQASLVGRHPDNEMASLNRFIYFV